MKISDLRGWLEEIDKLGKLVRIEGADWDLEVGAITGLNVKREAGPALLFDNIKGYPSGFRIATCTTSNPERLCLTLNMPIVTSNLELVHMVAEKLVEWESKLEEFPPQVVQSGPVLENMDSGDAVDLLKFPVPKWHELDGGRYIGTGHVIITRGPDKGRVNLGTYRVMVADRKTACVFIKPGSHGRAHLEEYHERGERCPILVSIGHHPVILRVGSIEVPSGTEYQFIGAVRGEPLKVIEEEITGLPMPADSEIVLAGWSYPGDERDEGPFGEWPGYYASTAQKEPAIKVERVYYRNDPIILGSPPGRPGDSSYAVETIRSALLLNELLKLEIPGIKGVWMNAICQRQFICISIRQRYAGHAKQVGLLASQSRLGNPQGRYVIVVDEDIDPTNIDDVLWAISTRSEPDKDIEIISGTVSMRLDPLIRKPANAFFNSRAIINACRPYEWKDEFPPAIEISPQLAQRVKDKWREVLQL